MKHFVTEPDFDADSFVSSSTMLVALTKTIETREAIPSKSKVLCCDPTTAFQSTSTPLSLGKNGTALTSRASFLAAVKVLKLQASFAEKTAADMEQIVHWYNKYPDHERFIKIKQSDSLPDNAIFYDTLHNRYPLVASTCQVHRRLISSRQHHRPIRLRSVPGVPRLRRPLASMSSLTEEASSRGNPPLSNPLASSSSFSPSDCSAEVQATGGCRSSHSHHPTYGRSHS
jgi:hypothetical protein